jgi:hypothetical protein
MDSIPYPIAHFLGYRKNPPSSVGKIALLSWTFLGILGGISIIAVVSRAIPLFRDHGAPIIVGSFVGLLCSTLIVVSGL